VVVICFAWAVSVLRVELETLLCRRVGCKILIGDPVNIAQHPRGQQKRLVVHDSTFVMDDTGKGSCGAPVMNSGWEVVAQHHAAIPATDRNGHVRDINGKTIANDRVNDTDLQIKRVADEGIRPSGGAADLPATHDTQRLALLELWDRPMVVILARNASLNGMTDG